MTRRSDIMRWGAALTALVYLFGWMIAFSHNVTEQHVVCAEHGDLVHVGHDDHGDHGNHGHSDEPVAVAEQDEQAGPSLDSVPQHDDHDHCAIGPFLRDDEALVSTSVVIATQVDAAPLETLSSMIESNRPPPVSILARAPKTSPPFHT